MDNISMYICAMQKALKIIAVMAILILYGMAVFHVYGMLSIQAEHSASIQKDRTESVFFADDTKPAGFALPAKISITAEASGPAYNINFQLYKFSAVLFKAASYSLAGSSSKYIPAWLNISIGLSVSDIIFPFHYFW
jgi:hypothetical protein